MDILAVGDRVRIDAKWHGDSWNNHLGTVVLNSSEEMQGLIAVSLDVLDETSSGGPVRYFDHVVRIHNAPVDGGTYVLDAEGLDALGVGARIEASAGAVSAIRKESGWESNWWTGILNSEDIHRYYSHRYYGNLSWRVLDEGAPLDPAPVPDATYVLDVAGLEALGEGARISALHGEEFVRGESWYSPLWGSSLSSQRILSHFTGPYRVLDEGASLEKSEPEYVPGTVLVAQSDGSLKVVHTPS